MCCVMCLSQGKMECAIMFLTHSHNVLLMMVLKEWRRVASLLAAKHDKVGACMCRYQKSGYRHAQ